jgi:arylsulfatase A-like enzyme
MIAGQIDFMIDQATNSLPHVRAGKVKAYAVTAKDRLMAAPDIPTVDEAGLPGFYVTIWLGQRGLWGKSTLYEETVGVPLLVAGEDIPEGRVIDTPSTLLNICPFILECVGGTRDDEQ